MLFLLYGPKRYLYGMFSHEACGGNKFFIAFDAFILRDGHAHNLFLILIHDCGTTEHQSSIITTLNIYLKMEITIINIKITITLKINTIYYIKYNYIKTKINKIIKIFQSLSIFVPE